MQTETPIRVHEVSFRYRDRDEEAIRRISFQVDPGEIFLIAGASGCGKTTLIRSINGLIPRSYKGELSGEILLYGENPGDWPLSKISQLVATVLQDPERQILGTKVLHEVAFGLENLGLPRQEIYDRVDQALAQLNILHLRDRETFNLSGGEKQKVALAGVLAMKPSILLLDEPLASLDPVSAQETLQAVRRLADQGMTVLMVEHRVEDVLGIDPERILYMQEGEIRYLGDIDGLIKNVDYHEVKLPAEMVIDRAREDPPPPDLEILPGVGEEEQPLVTFQDVSFSYEEGTEILHNINLKIEQGDVIAVLGPNGAGKTTFVKHAIGLLKPASGDVLVEGRSTRKASIAEIARTLGYVFQSPSHMLFAPTIYKELSFGPSNLGHSPEEIEKEVKQALKIVNLEDQEEDPPLSLSFGQQKRVSIAAILAMRSRILIMDEPNAGQDYENYINFMDSILQMPGFEAILFVTHDVDLALIYANRIILMSDGDIQADGPTGEVLSDLELLRSCNLIPTSLLKANLKRSPGINRFLRAEALAHVPD